MYILSCLDCKTRYIQGRIVAQIPILSTYAIDNPIHCYPSGHPHDFPDEEKIVALCKEIGFKNIKFKVEQVPWQFENEKKAALFLNKLHNAKCSPEESLNIAKKYLSHWHEKGIFYLEWQLFYLTAEK